jgi:Transposase DDE domain
VAGLVLAVVMTAACVQDRNAFEVLPRRWVVERTFAWISKHRRTVRDYERLPASYQAKILRAMITLMTRRLTRGSRSATPAVPTSCLTWAT